MFAHTRDGNPADSEFSRDPATWNAASYFPDPIDELEPLDTTTSEYRKCALRMFLLLSAIDTFMCSGMGATLRWYEVSLALGLDSTRGQTITDVANEFGVTKQTLSKGVTRFLRMSEMPPAYGLKSQEARIQYQETNGRREQPVSAQSDA